MKTKMQRRRDCRILLVDDDPDIQDLVAAVLRLEDVEIVSACDGVDAMAIARRENPGLILLDYEMPGLNGLEVLRNLQEDSTTASIPVIVVTGNDSPQLLTECFRAGATDYIRKPFCAPELRARVRSLLDRKHLLDELERLALYDSLTGLSNRTSIRERIQSAIDRAEVSDYALLYLDVDRFKLVNDSLGHDVGDQLLWQIAGRLRESLHGGNKTSNAYGGATAARLGGDEFVILFEDLKDRDRVSIVADRLLAALAEPYLLAGQQLCCTVSLGILTSDPSYTTPEAVLRDADTAMYEAKTSGKGRYVHFHPSMHSNAEQRLRIENNLRQAIGTEELFVVYQPIVSLETGRTTAFEALVRWKHPQQGLIFPADFLPIAEETGLIVPMGAWVLERACRDFAFWQRSLGSLAPDNIHVNLSRKQLVCHDLVLTVKRVLEQHALAPACLHLEVTESEIMQNPKVATAVLRELREMGVKIDMDDFGTGHSSLACLQELPIDVLKIDRSFVANMERSRSFAALVHAVTNLSQNLGLISVAEGIETPDQLAMLQSMDCDFGQGYYFAKPMPFDQVAPYLGKVATPAPIALPRCLLSEPRNGLATNGLLKC